jgi:hypothetical protein
MVTGMFYQFTGVSKGVYFMGSSLSLIEWGKQWIYKTVKDVVNRFMDHWRRYTPSK